MEKGWRTPAKRALLERTALQYQGASGSHKQRILARFMTVTGYVRKYAMWVLNHAEEVLQTADAPPQRYGSEVQQALVLAWETLNRICAKRLIPFLPDMIESLEQNGHLQLSEENRRIVLSMSAATADRLLRAQRSPLPAESFHDESWTAAQTAEFPFARLRSGMRPHRVFWKWTWWLIVVLHPGKFPLHAHAHGCGDWLDRMSPRAQPWTRGGARRLATRPHAVPVSCPGNRYRQRRGVSERRCRRLLRTRADHVHERTSLRETGPMLHRAEKWGGGASGGGPRSLGRRTRRSATRRTLPGIAPVCELLSAVDEASGKRV